MVSLKNSELEEEVKKMRATSQLATFWRRFRRHKLGMIGFSIFIIMVFFALTADILAPYSWEVNPQDNGPTPYGIATTLTGPTDTSLFQYLSPPISIEYNNTAPDPVRAAIESHVYVEPDLNHAHPIYAMCPFNLSSHGSFLPSAPEFTFSVTLGINETESIGLKQGGFLVQVVVGTANVANWTAAEHDPVDISDYLNPGPNNIVKLNIMDISPNPIKVVVDWSDITWYDGDIERSLDVNDTVFLSYTSATWNISGWRYQDLGTIEDLTKFVLRYGLPPFSVGPETGNFHWLGTDQSGHDILTGLIYGARISLAIGFLAQLIAVSIGVAIGSISGYYGGSIDDLLMRIVDIVYAIPFFFLSILVLSVFQEAIRYLNPEFGAPLAIALILGFIGWTGTARVTRAQFLSLRELEFADAARVIGASDARIIFKHLLPNALAPIIVLFTLGIASVILTEAGLAFLGLGNPDTPSWGQMLQISQTGMRYAWWPAVLPGLCIFFAVLAFNLMGDAIRDALDPRLKE
ncbi:MAG: ABC transporter permease [Promethearchaeota archaeon]